MSKGTVNKIFLVGRLGGEPEVRFTNNGTAVAKFTMATNRGFKDESGNWRTETDWHKVVAWAKLAEFTKDYLIKGMRVYVEGRIQYRKYKDRNDQDRVVAEVVANDIQMLSDMQPDAKEGQKEPARKETTEKISESSSDDSVPF
jgi:single-strand DNA-binding protein